MNFALYFIYLCTQFNLVTKQKSRESIPGKKLTKTKIIKTSAFTKKMAFNLIRSSSNLKGIASSVRLISSSSSRFDNGMYQRFKFN